MLVEIPVLPEAPSTDYHVPIAKVCKHEVTETQGKTREIFFLETSVPCLLPCMELLDNL